MTVSGNTIGVSNTGVDKMVEAIPPVWFVKERRDENALFFYEVGTQDGSHFVMIDAEKRWLSRDKRAAERLAKRMNIVMAEAVVANGAGPESPIPETGDGA